MTAKKLYHLLRDNVDAFVEMEMKAFHRELILVKKERKKRKKGKKTQT